MGSVANASVAFYFLDFSERPTSQTRSQLSTAIMTNVSPGRHSNRAFCIGADEFESETSFMRRDNRAGTSDPLGHLLTADINEHSPLILERIREESEDTITSIPSSISSSPKSEDRLPSSLDVFMVNDYDGSWKPSARFGRFEWDVEGFDNHLGMAHVSCMTMGTYQALQQIMAKIVIQRHVIFDGVEAFMHYLETSVTDSDFPHLGKAIKNVIENRIKALEKSEENNKKISKKHSSSTQSLNSEQVSQHPSARIPRNLISEPNNLASLDQLQEKKLTPSRSGLRWGASFVKPPPQTFTDPYYDNTSEHSVLISGAVPDATVCRLVAIRFDEAVELKEFLPRSEKETRTIYFLIGPVLPDHSYSDLARAFGTIVSNPVSNSVFDHLRSAEIIANAVDRFLAETVVIAPGKIVSRNYINGEFIRRLVNMQCEKKEKERATSLSVVRPSDVDVEKSSSSSKEEVVDNWLPLFRGVVLDLKKRSRHYWSDYGDAICLAILTVIAYMFCVTVVPSLTFAAILEMGTEGILSVKKCLVSQAFSGLIWTFFSCQPLLVMSPTGPFLVFEKALYKSALRYGYDFLEVRLYIGIWVFIISIACSMFNFARYIRLVTVFTEDIFCALISVIFFSGVCEFISHQYDLNPIVNLDYYVEKATNCTGSPNNCDLSSPNTFLIEVCMLVLSIVVFHYFRQIGISIYFGRTIRNLCKNFGGIFSVLSVTVLYLLVFKNVDVSMVKISDPGVDSLWPISGLVIPSQPPDVLLLLGTFLAACLLYVLIFVETEIPEQMALRSKRKLKKGGGLHWDPIVVGFCTLFSSFTGLPWMCPAAVQSLAHIDAVTVYEKTPRGDPKKIKLVREQRVSGLITYIMLFGVSLFGHYLPIPSAAIFGVFFYLGVRNLEGNQMVERMVLPFLMPKNRGSHKYLEMAPFIVITAYTLVQVIFVVLMYSIKSNDILGVFFPLFLVLIAGFNLKLLPIVFDDKLLEALECEEEVEEDDDEENPANFYVNTRIPV